MEGLNGADSASVNGVRNLPPFAMMEKLAEVEQTRFIERKEEAEAFTGAIPPLVKKRLDKKLSQFVSDTHVVVEHKGKKRDNVTLTIGDKKYTRKVDFSGDFAKCECGSAEVDKFPCGCMLLAAEKAGKPWADLLYSHDSVETWKAQYSGLVAFNLPGTAQLATMEPDEFVLPPATFPIPRGRPSTKRKKGLVEQFKKTSNSAKKARGAAAAAAAAAVAAAAAIGSPGVE